MSNLRSDVKTARQRSLYFSVPHRSWMNSRYVGWVSAKTILTVPSWGDSLLECPCAVDPRRRVVESREAHETSGEHEARRASPVDVEHALDLPVLIFLGCLEDAQTVEPEVVAVVCAGGEACCADDRDGDGVRVEGTRNGE